MDKVLAALLDADKAKGAAVRGAGSSGESALPTAPSTLAEKSTRGLKSKRDTKGALGKSLRGAEVGEHARQRPSRMREKTKEDMKEDNQQNQKKRQKGSN